MRKLLYFMVIFIVFISGCSDISQSVQKETKPIETSFTPEVTQTINNEKKYYALDDFSSIIIGKSTIEDVNKIVSTRYLVAASYGGFIECPMEDGHCIRIKFYFPDFVVGDIAVSEPTLK